ncbi:MAG: hypothetical protein Kow00107_09040 [Planctomycetota bacterium]
MQIFRKGQADTYRIAFGAILLITGVFAAYRWFKYFNLQTIFGTVRIDWLGAAVLILLGLAAGFYFAAVHKKTVNYIVDTDEEMRKVSWPSKEELKDSSILVIVVMIILGAITSVFDAIFLQLLKILS